VAFESVAAELSLLPGVEVTLFGSGNPRSDDPYRFVHCGNIAREHFERFPHFPILRSEYAWEEATFIPGLLLRYHPSDFDVTVTCSYPFVQWAMQLLRDRRNHHPALIFVTQNGDHAVHSREREFRWFSCDGLVCTNPEYFERNQEHWPSRLIPNGVDPLMFFPGDAAREEFDLPKGVPIALMVSALIESKRIEEGIRAAARVPGLHLVVCGLGPEREKVLAIGSELMRERFHLMTLPRHQMPAMYRSADVFLHMSLVEASANAYIEALASGLPIVTHDRYVTRWTLEQTSTLVDATSCPEVADGLMSALAKNSPDEVLSRRNLAEKRFSWSGIAREYHSFFQEIQGRNSKP
jgi:glycosyltransferase involved in cell wall biosynthesis